jgi:hypothetical protein
MRFDQWSGSWSCARVVSPDGQPCSGYSSVDVLLAATVDADPEAFDPCANADTRLAKVQADSGEHF